MRAQLEIQDAEGRNLAMLAARCGNVAILKSVMAEIHHTGVRENGLSALTWRPSFWNLHKIVENAPLPPYRFWPLSSAAT